MPRARRRVAAVALSLAALAALGGGASPVARGAEHPTCATPGHSGGDWPRMGRDLGHSRHQPDELVIDAARAATLAPAWTFSANDASGTENNEITGYPIVADGCVYVGTSTGNQEPGWVFAINADTGELVWKRQLSHGVYSSLAVADGRVFAFVSRVQGHGEPGPYVVALRQDDGEVEWETPVSTQQGSDAVSSPIVFDGLVWVGVSGTAAEGDESTRFDFRGQSVLLDAEDGQVLANTFVIPDEDWQQGEGDAGGALWSTISIDPATKYGFVGSGNPFNYESEHERTNAVLKIDLDRGRGTFGEIVDSYKGDVEEYFPQAADSFSCDEEDPIGFFLAGFECGRLDLDFGAAPNVVEVDGETFVGAGQKSGVYHLLDPDTMEPVWKQVVGVPSLVGGIVGTPAYDGDALYVPHTLAGYITSLSAASGDRRWVSPTADGVHWGNPVSSANGVVYTVDLKGFLDAYDARTGAPLLHRPLGVGADTGADPTFTWGGTSVARNTVYATVGVGLSSVGPNPPWLEMPDGFVIAFRPTLP